MCLKHEIRKLSGYGACQRQLGAVMDFYDAPQMRVQFERTIDSLTGLFAAKESRNLFCHSDDVKLPGQ